MGKRVRDSKTMWVSGLTTAAGVLGVLAGDGLISHHPKLVSGVLIALGAINGVLRVLTSEPIN